MKEKRFYPLFIVAFAICICCPPAMRGSTLFSDLGPAGNVYGAGGWSVAGAESSPGGSMTTAGLFTVSGTGSLPVTGVDLAVANVGGLENTFYASIWTDNGGLPGVEVAGAYWDLSTSASYSSCCDLVSITGIAGVTLTGGQQYFMILGPLSISDYSDNAWYWNNQGVDGLILRSTNTQAGGAWMSYGTGNPLGAFDVTSNASTPEPATWPMLLGLAGAGLWQRLRKRSIV